MRGKKCYRYIKLTMRLTDRYGSYYAEVLRNLDQSHPGLRTLLLKKGLTAQPQEKHPCRTGINQRGEQSIN